MTLGHVCCWEQVGALGRLLEQQIVVTTAALPQQLLEALLREAGAKAVVCRSDGAPDDVIDAAAAAKFFTAFYAALHRGASIGEVRSALPAAAQCADQLVDVPSYACMLPLSSSAADANHLALRAGAEPCGSAGCLPGRCLLVHALVGRHGRCSELRIVETLREPDP
jgi:hypothetical protein